MDIIRYGNRRQLRFWVCVDGLCEIVIGVLLLAGAAGATVALPIPTWFSVPAAGVFVVVGILLMIAAFRPIVVIAPRPIAVANAAGAVILVVWLAVGHRELTTGGATFVVAVAVTLSVLAGGEWLASGGGNGEASEASGDPSGPQERGRTPSR
jgi:hypothetical protein